jgi:isocitrate dehydrogenase
MTKITFSGGKLSVPDDPTVPFLRGDGIGPEITAAMQRVVNAAVEQAYGDAKRIDWLEVAGGEASFEQTGEYLPDATMEAFREYLIGIKGPLGTPVGKGHRSLNVAVRQELDLYACVRPVRWFRGVESPVKHPERVNITVFRENTEDIYAGIEWPAFSEEAKRFGGFLQNQMGVTKVRFPESSAYGVKPVSEEGSKRLVRAAFDYAVAHDLPSVTLVHKGNIMKFTEGGFRKWGYEIAQDYPRIECKDVITDAFLQAILLEPQNFSVVATMNLNGDYISDALAAQVGGIGISPGANINYVTGHAIFEATHGTAPGLVGRNEANPSSLLLSAVMMLEHLGWDAAGQLIIDAMESSFSAKRATGDLSGLMEGGYPLTTSGFADELIDRIGKG